MMTYGTMWAVYLLAAALIMVVVYWLSSGFKHAVTRCLIRYPAFAVLFTPIQIEGVEPQWLAPNIAAIAVDLVASEQQREIEYAQNIAFTVVIAIVFAIAVGLYLQSRKAA